MVDSLRQQAHAEESARRAAEAADSIAAVRSEEERRAAARREELADRARALAERRLQYLSAVCDGSSAPAVIVTAQGGLDMILAQKLADRIGGRTDCIKPAFVTDGLFGRVFSGDATDLVSLTPPPTARVLVLVELTSENERVTPAGEPMVKVTVRVSARVLRTAESMRADGVSAGAQGVGFTRSEARENAVTTALDSLSARILRVLPAPAIPPSFGR
jgi:hypothetical protein